MLPQLASSETARGASGAGELRADAAAALLPLLSHPRTPSRLAVEVLTWSSDRACRPLCVEMALKSADGRGGEQPHTSPPPPVGAGRTCRTGRSCGIAWHPSVQAESVLPWRRGTGTRRTGRRGGQPGVGAGAGWQDVRQTLQQAGVILTPSAHSAAGRPGTLGEREALSAFRQTLTSEDSQRVTRPIR